MGYEQLTIFDYQPVTIDFAQLIADGLSNHCKKWGYDFVERLKESNGKQFYNIFCRITKTYYVCKNKKEYYSVEFSKDGKVMVKRCGKNYGKREPDRILDVQDIIYILIRN